MTDDQPLTLEDIIKEEEQESIQTLANQEADGKKTDSSAPPSTADFLQLPASVKVAEKAEERILEKTCHGCRHIFFSKIPLKYFYSEIKKGQHYQVVKLPLRQYPANLPEDILKLIQTDQCPNCRKKTNL